jgi:hypothetical protein
MPVLLRQKITLAEMRGAGVRGFLIYCSDYHCSHWTTLSADGWPDDVRLSDLEPRFTCQACGRRGARMCGLIGNRLKHILKRGWRRRFDDPILVEGHANPLLLAPDDVTGNVRAVRPKDKVETLGDVEGIRNIERRPGNGNVAD